MHLVQLFLPTADNDGNDFPKSLFSRVRSFLIDRFGGITAYTRSPAKGIWVDDGAQAVGDDLVVYEVVVDPMDPDWWHAYVKQLEAEFRQERLHVRAFEMQLL